MRASILKLSLFRGCVGRKCPRHVRHAVCPGTHHSLFGFLAVCVLCADCPDCALQAQTLRLE